MDAASRVLILMIAVALLVGAVFVALDGNFTVEKIYQTNKNYYPSVTDQSVNKQVPDEKAR